MDHALKHTSFACAHYQAGDKLGKLLAYVSLTPLFLLCAQTSKVYSRREVHEAFILLGMLVNEGVARTLKDVFKHPRPSTCHMLRLCHSYGMPSSHTSMMFFFLGMSLLAASRRPWDRHMALALWGALELVVCATLSVAVGVSRVYLGYHSMEQVAAGAALGVLLAIGWHGLLILLHPVLRGLPKVQLFALFGVKDTWNVPETLKVEHEAFLSKKDS